MRKYSLCIIDDKIPVKKLTDIKVDDKSIIDKNILIHCLSLSDEVWGDSDLKNFISNIKDDNEFIISGFQNHDMFFNYKEEIVFTPDIIIFDWDTGSENPADNLLEILNTTYCFVAVFTSADKNGEIKNELAKTAFKNFENRLFIIHKDEADSVLKIKSEIDERKKHFSFEFGNLIRKTSMNALDEILVELGVSTSDDLIKCLNIEEDQNDFREYIVEKYSSLLDLSKVKIRKGTQNSNWIDDLTHIVKKKFEKQLRSVQIPLPEQNYKSTVDENTLEKLWSYRLYHKYSPTDNIVRKGDIISKDDALFLVVNSDCDLKRFWNKNYGFLNIVPLLKVSEDNKELIRYLTLTKTPASFKHSSFSQNPKELPEGTFCIPFIPQNDAFTTYILLAKRLSNINVSNPDMPANELKKRELMYNDLDGYQRVCTLSEPFLTPLIYKILETISGNGTPDYSSTTVDLLNNKLKSIIK